MTEIDEKKNLGGLFGSVRDQGERPTCLAFAVSDLHAGLREAWVPLSCEFLFYHAQRRAGRPANVGATLPVTLEALQYDGQPREEEWPYLDAASVDGASWKPPQNVGEVYRRPGEHRPDEINQIIALLDQGRPLLVLLYLSMSFYLAGWEGLIDLPTGEQSDVARRHAVVVIGHGMHKGQRVFLIRNSWGDGWGRSGHARLTEQFLKLRMFGCCVLAGTIDVTLPAATA